jgi:hypothetical protein
MVVEIKQLSLKGRFGPSQAENTDPRNSTENMRDALEVLRRDLLREMDRKLESAARRTRER